VAGQGGLGHSAVPDGQQWAFADSELRGVALRRVTLERSQPANFRVVVAQTVRDRVELLREILVLSVVPQLLLLGLLGVWMHNVIGRELQPLEQLQRAVDQRGSRDLQPLGVQTNTRDMARLTSSFEALLARIHEAHVSQREFTGNVAHELRTPLAGIRSLAEFGLQDSQAQVPLMQLQLRRILSSTERASHLIDQLLALALADEMREGLPLAPVAADELLREMLLALLPRADALGVDWGATGLDTPTGVLGSAALLEGLVGNLLDNALRYGRPAPGVQQRVTLELTLIPGTDAGPTGAAEVLIAVTDNGPGMDESQRQQVRQRWAQGAEGQRVGEGSGLGLAIAARYAALLGGRLLLDAAVPGPGLRAAVVLKQAPTPAGDARAAGLLHGAAAAGSR
jgi:two-component system, OmpR family, sensor histidine kinase TctE